MNEAALLSETNPEVPRAGGGSPSNAVPRAGEPAGAPDPGPLASVRSMSSPHSKNLSETGRVNTASQKTHTLQFRHFAFKLAGVDHRTWRWLGCFDSIASGRVDEIVELDASAIKSRMRDSVRLRVRMTARG